MVLSFLCAGPAAAQETRAEKTGAAPAARPLLSETPSRPWSALLAAGLSSDSNIARLLTNSAAPCDTNIKDNLVYKNAEFSVFPFGKAAWKLELSGAAEARDYRAHRNFSYRYDSLAAGLSRAVGGGFTLELDGGFAWAGDKAGAISDARRAGAALAWRGPARLRVKAGYEYESDRVFVNRLKDGESHAAFARISRPLAGGHTGFVSARLQARSAAGPNYAYRSASLTAGAVSRWSQAFRTALTAQLAARGYSNTDTRFLKKRRDRTVSVSFKPSLELGRGLAAAGSASLVSGASNVAGKSYKARLFSLGLEWRF